MFLSSFPSNLLQILCREENRAEQRASPARLETKYLCAAPSRLFPAQVRGTADFPFAAHVPVPRRPDGKQWPAPVSFHEVTRAFTTPVSCGGNLRPRR